MVEPGVYPFPKMDRIAFGQPWADALVEAVERVGARRVFALASATLAKALPLEADLGNRLGDRFAGLHVGIRPHTPREDVVAAAERARSAGADLIVTIGGSSVTDAGKGLQLCLAAGVRQPAALDPFRAAEWDAPERRIPTFPVRMMTIPTTLSGAEFTSFAGITDLARQRKESFGHPQMIPQIVILDPRITLPTPMELWLSSGMRAVDHAVETLCSIRTQPLFEAVAARALALLAGGLPRTRQDPADLDARLDSMLAVWLSLIGPQAGAPLGASHAIGHVLGGTAGVPHGFTSFVMLAHVLRWNKAVNADRQQLVAAAFGHPDAEAGDLIADLVRRLGLPVTLRDVGVKREQLPLIAQNSMHDRWTATNPRKIAGPDDVSTLLEMAW